MRSGREGEDTAMKGKGTMFRTEGCEIIGSVWNGYPTADFRYRETILYRRPTGGHFLYSCEGPLARAGGGEFGGGFHRAYRNLSAAHAREWAQVNLPEEDVKKHFSEE